MPTSRPDPKVTPDRTADADGTSPPDPTQPNNGSPPTSHLDARPFPFLSPPTQPDDLGQLGPYRVVKLLGEGGMGFVFRGEDDALRRPVALKVMRPEVAAGENARERFLREGRAAAAVRSDHVITIYQVGEANGVPFLAMEFLAGSTLDDWLKGRGGSVAPAAIVKVAKDTLRGLGAAHDRGLIHRDIKPANLWLEAGTGRVKVLDFGLTRGSDDVLTREGALVGTPSYMAPEQAAGRAVDPRADLFSVGVVLYRMAAGRNPFQRGDVWATLTALAVDVPPPAGTVAAGLPAGLGELIDRLVAKNAADRPESARAALAELAEVERAMKGGTAADVPVVTVPVVYAPPAVPDVNNTWAAVTEAVTEYDDAPAAAPGEPAAARRRSAVPLAAGLLGLAVVAGGAVGLAVVMRPPAADTVNADPPPGDKTPRPTPTPKPPEKLLIPAPGPVVKAGPSPFDALDPAKIPTAERVPWLPKDTVAVIGSHRGEMGLGAGGAMLSPIVLSPDGKWVAAAGVGIILYDAATLLPRWCAPSVPGGTFGFSPDGKYLAYALPARPSDASHGVRVLDLTGPAPRVVNDLAYRAENGTTAINFLPDGHTLVTGTGWGNTFFWTPSGVASQAPSRRISGNATSGISNPVRQLYASADGKRLVVVMDFQQPRKTVVRGWDVTGEPKEVFTLPDRQNVGRVALSAKGDRLFLPWFDATKGVGELWDVSGPTPGLLDVYGLPRSANVVAYTPDGDRVVVSGPGAAQELAVGTGKIVRVRALPDRVAAITPDLSRIVQPAGQRMRVLDGDGKSLVEPGDRVSGWDAVPVAAGGRVFTFHPGLRAWAVEDGRLNADPQSLADPLGEAQMIGAAVSPDGRMVAGAAGDHSLRTFVVGPPARFGAVISRAEFGSTVGIGRFAWQPGGPRVAVTSGDGAVYLWDMSTNPPSKTLVGSVSASDRAGKIHLAAAPVGDMLAACDTTEPGGGVTLRRVGNPNAPVRHLAGVPDEFAHSSQFLADGRTLLVAFGKPNAANRVRRYDLTNRDPVPDVLWELPRQPQVGEYAHAIQLSRDGTCVLGYLNTWAYVVDIASRRELIGVDLGEQIQSQPRGQVRWADDGRHVLIGQHGCVYVLRVPDGPAAKP